MMTLIIRIAPRERQWRIGLRRALYELAKCFESARITCQRRPAQVRRRQIARGKQRLAISCQVARAKGLATRSAMMTRQPEADSFGRTQARQVFLAQQVRLLRKTRILRYCL